MSDAPKTPLSKNRRSLLKSIAAGGALAGVRITDAATASEAGRFPPAVRAALDEVVEGKIYWPEDSGYELARASTAYRANKPRRFPGVIVRPTSDKDVVAAVTFAKQHGLQVTTRSGGHSWSSSHIRDKVMLIDMSRMQNLEIDAKNKTLWTNPGVIGSRINAELKQHNLVVPTAHHPSPGIGGFCMNGGFGWNSRLWGNGAAHILAIDVVTADGKLIRADSKQNTDYLWAARGSGAGFFGVVTRMQLRCNPLPPVMKVSAYSFREEVVEELFTWARNTVSKIPPYLEFVISSTAHDSRTGEASPVRLTMAALALTDTQEQADRALDILKTCPCLDKAYFKVENKDTTLEERYAGGYSTDPAGYRYAADNIYTNAPAEELVPHLRKLFCELPTPRSHVFWMTWGPVKPYPDTQALSVQADVYLGAYSIWDDPARDEELELWPVTKMKELDALSVGAQMNDENMLRHPQKYLSTEAYAKLERLRAKYDPERVFASYLGLPYKTTL